MIDSMRLCKCGEMMIGGAIVLCENCDVPHDRTTDKDRAYNTFWSAEIAKMGKGV